MSTIETLLQQILDSQKQMQSDISEIKGKVNAVYDQTADLTEFKTSISDKLDKISEDIEYLTHKEHQTEKEVYSIKKKLEVIR